MGRRITLRDVADHAGVTAATVSMALRGDRRISETTRLKVAQAAEALGYRPDAALSALASLRWENSKSRNLASIVFLTHSNLHSRNIPFHKGAEQRASTLGYNLSSFTLEEAENQSRANQILKSRGVRGIIIGSLPQDDYELRLDWDEFCAVRLGYSLAEPHLNYVAPNFFQVMALAWKKLVEFGYKRPGFVSWHSTHRRVRGQWEAAHRMMQAEHCKPEDRIPTFFTDWGKTEGFTEWVKSYQPDIVISKSADFYKLLLKSRFRVPEDIGFLHLNSETEPTLSGIDQHSEQLGAAALELVHVMLQGHQFGVPEITRGVAIEGSWNAGSSMAPRK